MLKRVTHLLCLTSLPTQVLLLILLLTGLSARAQPPTPAPTPGQTTPAPRNFPFRPLVVLAGGLFLAEEPSRRAIGDPIYSLGVGYDFAVFRELETIVFQGYLDIFLPQQETVGSARTSLNTGFGIGVTARYVVTEIAVLGFRPYFGLGLGLYSFSGSQNFTDTTGTPRTRSATARGIRNKAFFGVEFSSRFAFEVEFTNLPGFGGGALGEEGIPLGGYQLRAGYRF